jgi:hypothetical protein
MLTLSVPVSRAAMAPIHGRFAGGPVGSGDQWVSWVHLDDLVGLMVLAVRSPNMKGVYNATAPNPVRMGQLCAALGSAMGRPSWLPVPDFALKGLLGEGSATVLEGQRVLPARTQQGGFDFTFPEVRDAVNNLVATRK